MYCQTVWVQFLQFTVGTTLSQIASRQRCAPTAEQFCCTVGRNHLPDSLRSILLPTVNCRNYGEGIVGKNNCIRRYVSA